MTSFTWTSRQARTQRVHWMQASRFTAIAGCEISAFGCFLAAKRGSPTPRRLAQLSTLFWSVYCSFGMSESKSSSTIFCEVSARREVVVTSMPVLPVIARDGFDMDAVVALRPYPLRRAFGLESTADISPFYLLHG